MYNCSVCDRNLSIGKSEIRVDKFKLQRKPSCYITCRRHRATNVNSSCVVCSEALTMCALMCGRCEHCVVCVYDKTMVQVHYAICSKVCRKKRATIIPSVSESCSYCHSIRDESNGDDLVPCSSCTEHTYCNDVCRDLDQKYHKH